LCAQRATHLLDLDRFWHTWRRVRHTYRMATAFEDASGFKFDIMVRLRPDLLFLKEGDTSSIEGFLSNPVSAEKDSRGSSGSIPSPLLNWTNLDGSSD